MVDLLLFVVCVLFFNHFLHKMLVSFPYFLLASMDHAIKEHCKNPKLLVLHLGLILLIMKFMKTQEPKIESFI